jgi:hypothetical protein
MTTARDRVVFYGDRNRVVVESGSITLRPATRDDPWRSRDSLLSGEDCITPYVWTGCAQTAPRSMQRVMTQPVGRQIETLSAHDMLLEVAAFL